MIGQTISHYKILEKLGEGGMGIVYKAQDSKLDRIVALKFLPPGLVASSEDVARFKQEAKTISSLSHPHIATIHDIDETEGRHFLVLEYLSGGTLKTKIKQLHSSGGTLPLKNVVEYGVQIAEGLAHAHRHDIIHRDVKTDNMMVTEEGTVKITDFGLAKFLGGPQLTRSGSVVGTTAYMSPEQVRGEELDMQSDLFSYGIVLYELATGHLPFRGDHDAAVSYSIVNEKPLELSVSGATIPSSLGNVIHRCLEKDKENRYQTAEEIVADLRRIQMEMSGYETRRPPAGKLSRRSWLITSASVILIALGIYVFLPSKVASVDMHSIAVLPFKNLNTEKETEYFAEGITEDVIAQLNKISKLRVVSPRSVLHDETGRSTYRDMGIALNVATVLEGSVRREGNNVRIVAHLIDARADGYLWTDTYDKEFTDIFAIQLDVAKKIARTLEATISSGEEARLGQKATENLEAYDLYLKGRYHFNRRRPADLQKSIEYFEEALRKDPVYSSAFAGLADSYIILGDFNMLPPKDTYPKATEAAMKALQLDSLNAEAHTSLAYALMHYDRDWPTVEKEFRRALELAPNSAQTHSWYALYLSLKGRFGEAATESQRARVLDSFSAVVLTDAGLTAYFSRKYDFAIDLLREALTVDPTFIVANLPLGAAYIQKQMDSAAIAAFQQVTMASAIVTSKANPVPIAALAYVCGDSRRTEDALMYIELLEQESKERYVAPYWMAIAYAGIGNVEQEFLWLEKAYEKRDGSVIFLKVEPIFDKVKSDPRFPELLKKLGLQE